MDTINVHADIARLEEQVKSLFAIAQRTAEDVSDIKTGLESGCAFGKVLAIRVEHVEREVGTLRELAGTLVEFQANFNGRMAAYGAIYGVALLVLASVIQVLIGKVL